MAKWSEPDKPGIIWTDVETTGLGLGEEGERDLLLQVACIITDPLGNTISDPYEIVIKQDREKAYEQANDFVREMHTKTGLWDRLEHGREVDVVDRDFHAFLKDHLPEPRTAPLGGNSVDLDRRFLRRFLPQSEAHMHYRVVDVSSIAYAHHYNHDIPFMDKRETHDALDDIRESIEEYRYFMRQVRSI